MKRFKVWSISTIRSSLIESYIWADNNKDAREQADSKEAIWAIEINGDTVLTDAGLRNMLDWAGTDRMIEGESLRLALVQSAM